MLRGILTLYRVLFLPLFITRKTIPTLMTSTVGRVMPGWLGGRYSRFNTTIGFTVFTVVLVFCVWIAAPWKAGRIVFAALYGFGSGTFVSMVPTLVAQVFPDMSQLGLHLGAVYIVVAPSVLIAQPVGGVLADAGDRHGRDPYVWLKVLKVTTRWRALR